MEVKNITCGAGFSFSVISEQKIIIIFSKHDIHLVISLKVV